MVAQIRFSDRNAVSCFRNVRFGDGVPQPAPSASDLRAAVFFVPLARSRSCSLHTGPSATRSTVFAPPAPSSPAMSTRHSRSSSRPRSRTSQGSSCASASSLRASRFGLHGGLPGEWRSGALLVGRCRCPEAFHRADPLPGRARDEPRRAHRGRRAHMDTPTWHFRGWVGSLIVITTIRRSTLTSSIRTRGMRRPRARTSVRRW